MASVRTMITLSRDEINDRIPYMTVCIAREGRSWNTMRRRRRWTAEFTESERDKCSKLFALAHAWYLTKGVPDFVEMSTGTIALWLKLGRFCYEIL